MWLARRLHSNGWFYCWESLPIFADGMQCVTGLNIEFKGCKLFKNHQL